MLFRKLMVCLIWSCLLAIGLGGVHQIAPFAEKAGVEAGFSADQTHTTHLVFSEAELLTLDEQSQEDDHEQTQPAIQHPLLSSVDYALASGSTLSVSASLFAATDRDRYLRLHNLRI